jgi:hypothetical protein
MTSDERHFERLLEEFRSAADLPQRYLRADLRLNDRAIQNLDVHRELNRNAEFWAVAANALHLATFVSLHRIFDTDSAGNVYGVLDFAQQHIDLFSKTALATRRQQVDEGSLKSEPDVRADDLLTLRKEVGRRRRIYDDTYRPIRGKILAHKVLPEAEAQERYASTLIVELHEICTFFPALHDALLRLYMNGVRPVVNCPSLSLEEIRNGATANASQSAVVRHADRIVDSIVEISAKKGG